MSTAALVAGEIVWTPPARLALPRRGTTNCSATAAGPEDRVLVLGRERADLLCAALRRGCRSAIGLVAPERHPDPADVVIAPRVATQEEAFAIADCAHRAMRGAARRGRLVIGLVGASAAGLGRVLMHGLVGYGFTRGRLRARGEGRVLLICDMPPVKLAAGGR
jgi:hypothetical protein